MKAIETRYAGRLFRSRLEARWAVFLDHMWLQWEYESEGFPLPSGPYLPDFFLRLDHPQHQGGGYWVEIKPRGEPSELELRRVEELCRETGHNGYLIAGNPNRGEFQTWKFSRRYPHAPNGGLIYYRSELDNRDWLLGIPSEWLLCTDVPWSPDRLTSDEAFALATAERFESGRRLPHGFTRAADVIAGATDGVLGTVRRMNEARDQAKPRPEGTESA